MQHKHPFLEDHCYHIYNRGVARQDIFRSKYDYQRFLMLMYICNTSQKFKLSTMLDGSDDDFIEILKIQKADILVGMGPWCLMTNHFHMILKQQKAGGITEFLRRLTTAYTMYFNKKYARTGALFGGTFKSKLIDSEEYMRYLFQYIHMNPLDILSDDWEEDFIQSRILTEDQSRELLEYPYSSYLDFIEPEFRPHSSVLTLKEFDSYFSTL